MAHETSDTSLTGRRIVITGLEIPSHDLFSELKLRGAEVISLPRLEVSELERFERLDEAIDHLYGYDWLLFTSVNGLEYFLRRLQVKGLDSSALDELKVCGVGTDVEKLLGEKQIHVDVVPPSSRNREVFDSLEQFVGGPEALAGLNLLWPRATSAPDSLARTLTEAGARIDLVPSYRTVSADADLARMAAMISGAADCVVLTDVESLTQVARLFDTHDLSQMLSEVLILSFDEEIARRASEYCLHVTTLPNPGAIAEALQPMGDHFAG